MRTKHFKLTLLIGAVLILISSCKKGEDDPAFTFASRKARVAGDWKMSSGSATIGVKDSLGTHGDLVYKFNESDCDISDTYKGVTTHMDYNFTISFTKDGEVTMKQTIGSETLEANGTWDFLLSQGKFSSKERMTIQLNSISSGVSNDGAFFNKGWAVFTYRIKELRSDKMVLVTEQELETIDNTGFSYFVTSEYTLVQ